MRCPLGVWGLGFMVYCLRFRVWGLGFRVWGLGFRVQVLPWGSMVRCPILRGAIASLLYVMGVAGGVWT